MSDNVSDADKIRKKRLAKLGNQGASNPNADTTSNSEQRSSTPTTPRPQIQQSPSATKQQSDSQTRSPRINIGPASDTPSTSTRSETHPRTRSQQRTSSRDRKPEEWEHDTLSSLFRITLDPTHTTDRHGNALYFAKAVAEELESEGAPRTLTVPSEESSGSLDSCITDAASNHGKKKPLEYLLQCWKRITRLSRQVKAAPQDVKKTHVVNEARRLCMSYSIFAVTIPDMFESEEQSTSFLPNLLVDPDTETALDFEWLQEAVSRLGDDDELKCKLIEAVEEMSQELAQKSMNDPYQPYVQALARLLRFNPLIAAISESPMFLGSNVQAQDLEKNTLLGPFFRLSPLQSEVALNYFSAPKTRDRAFIANSQNALRITLSQHQASLFDIVERFLKVKSARDKLLDWFALTVNGNHRRRAMQVDHRYVSSDGFMVNVTACLDRLCEPFMDASFAKIDRIDINYLRRSPRVDISDETKINADQAASDKFYAEKLGGENNFISEVFFLCAAAHHYGTEAAQTKLKDSRKYLKRLDEQIESFAAERSKYENGPPQILQVFDQRLQQAKDDQDKKHSTHHATEGVLLDEQLQLRAMSFMRYIVVWLMRLVTGVDFPKQKNLTLPLPVTQPEHIKCLPEYFLDDVVDHFKFVTEVMPHVITPTQCEELVMICITFLESSEYIKNPGLKSGMVVILFHGVWPTRNSTTGALGGLLNSLPFATKYLLHALMKAFIECESTGTHTQFYDKFNTRYEIFQIVKCIWSNPVYRDKLGIEASENVDFFVRFTNLLMNDSTFLLDEVFSSFHKITSLEKEITSPTFSTMPEADQTQKKELLEEQKRTAKNYMPLVQENLHMMKIFTSALASSFTMPELVQRLADMMDYNLDAMVGPKKNTLRVNDMDEYKFHPASMLSDIADVYLNLASKPAFHLAIARDGRSYRASNFIAAEEILRTKANRSTSELLAWKKLARDIEAARIADEAEEEDLGEIPEEFLDPLLATLMTDPVVLPTSRSVVDRSTIRQMLLSEERDPFNRAPLKMEDVLPDTELKKRIEAFRAEKRGRRGQEVDRDADAMDTSQG